MAKKRMVMELGMGSSLRQQDYTRAACRAVEDALWHNSLSIADAFGLAFFNVMGLQKALAYGATPFVAVALGTMTGVFGGLIRDVICREIPLVLKGELYATACILGGGLYVVMMEMAINSDIALFVALITTLLVRLGAMKWNWHLPVFPPHQ